MADSSASAERSDSSQANLAAGMAVATLVAWVIFVIAEIDGPIWLLIAALGAATPIMGWRAGSGARPTGRALAAVVVSIIAVLAVIGGAIMDAAG